MHEAYARLATVLRSPDRPAELVPHARLLYGQHEVLVEMTAVDGAPCSDEEVTKIDGPVMRAAAWAIAWLASQCVIYTDLRGPNVLKPLARPDSIMAGGTSAADASYAAASAAAGAPDAWLIDYDDCMVTAHPVCSLEGYLDALRSFVQAQDGLFPLSQTFAEQLVHDGFPQLRTALEAAFAALPRGSA